MMQRILPTMKILETRRLTEALTEGNGSVKADS